MALTELWKNSRNQLVDKHVRQVIAFAGDGNLSDGNSASSEFRDFLTHIPTPLLCQYADQCLSESFNGSGYALQDIVNQAGRRLGFQVIDGRYRGTKSSIGYDGLWHFPSGHGVIVEVKTTDAYRIDLNVIAKYRRELISEGTISEDISSILIIVGRKDTGDLEAQIRGSRHAWDMRLLSIDALMTLVVLKEEVEDPAIVNRIHNILIPREFTKLDEIVDIVFSATEDVKQDEVIATEEETDEKSNTEKTIPVSFHAACIERIEKYFNLSPLKRSRSSYSTPDNSLSIICSISKSYERHGQVWYWFAFHPHQQEFLSKSEQGYIALGCGSEETILLMPLEDFEPWLEGMNITERDERFYWHVHIHRNDGELFLHRKKGKENIEVTKYLLPKSVSDKQPTLPL